MEEINKWIQDLDPIASPHKEEKLIGGNIDLDLLFLLPQEDARIIGGIERKQDPKGQQWWEKTFSKGWGSLGKKPPLNRSPKIQLLQPKYVQGLVVARVVPPTGTTGVIPVKFRLENT
jgi:hypothetical protein